MGSDSGVGGVSIMVEETWSEHFIDVRRINDRILIFRLLLGKYMMTVVSAYAPQVGLGEDIKDKYWGAVIQVQ